jgi:hypothetical protein
MLKWKYAHAIKMPTSFAFSDCPGVPSTANELIISSSIISVQTYIISLVS